ncbi:MAG: sigma-70 family RNA polymerase sigma factor [Planctomycetes bacterium]|nr:sigma-70 family RNA polymerase sigma factor [Planctomycetota bacterium]
MTDTTRFPVLLAAAIAGDRHACDRLFGRAADRLQLYVRLRLGERLRARVDSLDVLQETFLCAHRDVRCFDAVGPGEPERRFAQWLCRIADRRILDLASRHGAARRDVGREQRDVTRVLRDLQRSGHGPATSLVRQEERARLADAIEALDASDREIVVLRHFEGESIDAIAQRIGRSATAVRRVLGRVTVELGRKLAEIER